MKEQLQKLKAGDIVVWVSTSMAYTYLTLKDYEDKDFKLYCTNTDAIVKTALARGLINALCNLPNDDIRVCKAKQ